MPVLAANFRGVEFQVGLGEWGMATFTRVGGVGRFPLFRTPAHLKNVGIILGN